MIVSMTGFAHRSTTVTNSTGISSELVISLKTVNSRYFEANCRLPHALNYLETELTKKMKAQLHRGYAQLTISVGNPALFQGTLTPNVNLARGYVNGLKELQQACKLPGELNVNDLLRIKDIFAVQETVVEEDPKVITPLFELFETVVALVVERRTQEGKALQTDLEGRHTFARKEIEAIKARSNELMEQRKTRLQKELLEFEDLDSEPAQLRKQALMYELDKMDIHEEITRFESHLQALESIFANKDKEKGRRIDFMLQELSREINTIAAKCSDATMSAHAINVKVELEKAREQTQNIV